jgi:hypothetical protein
MNYHWDKARRKAEKIMSRLPNDEEFILVTPAGVVAYAQLQNYIRTSQEMLKFTKSNYVTGETPYHQEVAKKCDNILKELEELEQFMKAQETVVPDGTETPPPAGETPSEPEASGTPQGEAKA